MGQQYLRKSIELLFLGIGTVFDFKTRTLPRSFFVIFGALGIFCKWIFGQPEWKNMMAGILLGMTFLLIGRITKEAIGYGDGLGILILGIFEGGKNLAPMVFYAFLISSVYGIFRLLICKKSKQDTMPFFPFLFFSAVGVMII